MRRRSPQRHRSGQGGGRRGTAPRRRISREEPPSRRSHRAAAPRGAADASHLLIFRANALRSAAGNVAMRRAQEPTARTAGACLGAFTGAARCGLESRRPSDSFGWQLPRFTFLAEIERGGRAQPPALPAPTRRAPLRARHPQPGTPSPVPDSLEDSEAKRGSGRAHRGGKAPAEEGGYRPHRTYPDRPRHLSSGYRGVGVTHTRSSALHVRGSNRGRFSITWHAGVRFGQAVVARYVRSALESVPTPRAAGVAPSTRTDCPTYSVNLWACSLRSQNS